MIIGNADAHGKDVAFLLGDDGQIELAPIYDTVPTMLFPQLRADAAMSIGAAVSSDAVDLAALEREARSWKHSWRTASAAISRCAGLLFEGVERGVVDRSGNLAKRVLRMAPRFSMPS